jgi:chromosome segregation ATPase
VQILTAICAARPDRLQECVLNAPLGTSRVVGVLDDARDAVRNAGLLLLVDLTGGANEDLRKIVAFEDVFGKVFALMRMEGGLADAGIAGQDCLSLLANLIHGSASNQTMFRESGCVGHFAKLLQEVFPPESPEAQFVAESREKAGWGVLQLLRLFLARGETSTIQNQAAFFRAGVAQTLLDMSFHPGLPVPVRVAALKSTSDLIANNPPIQEQFAALQLALPTENDTTSQAGSQTNGSRSNAASARNSARPSVEKARAYVIEALLDLTLDQPRSEAPLRAAACSLIQAYLANHDRIKNHFLQRAISGYTQGEEAANVLTALLQPGTDTQGVLFASWIVQDLLIDVFDAKVALAAIKEGNESEGEEVLTAVQALASQLETAMQTGADERVIAAYASTLVVFLWEFADGINDLLAEGSGLVQTLVASVSSGATAPIIAGLAASLLGTVYEFSTKDSPISRRTLTPLLTQKLGRGKYLDALLAFRRDPVIRDFGIEEPTGDSDVLSEPLVDLFQTEYTRLRKAIDKDPGVEVLPFADIEAGVDRDVLDDLRQQIHTVKDTLSQTQKDAQELRQQAEHDKMTLQKEGQSASAEVNRLRKINEAMQKGHEDELNKLQAQHQREKEGLNIEHSRTIANARQEAERQARQAHQQQEQGFAGRVQEYERKLAELGNAHRTEQAGHNNLKQQFDGLRKQHSEILTRHQNSSRQLQDLTKTYQDLERAHQQLQSRFDQAEAELEKSRKDLSERDADVASLYMQIKELKDDIAGKEQELATEREGYTSLEKEVEAIRATSETRAASESEALKKIEALEKELEAAKSVADAQVANESEATAKIETLEKELATMKSTSEAKAASESEAAAKIKTLEDELEKARLASEAKAAGDTEAAAKIKALEKELERSKSGSDDKAARIEKLEAELEKAKSASKALSAGEGENAAKIGALEKELESAKSASDEKAATIKTLETELEKAKSAGEGEAADKIKSLEKELESAKTSSDDKAATIKTLETELEKAKSASTTSESETKTASKAKATGDSEVAGKVEKLERLSKGLTSKVKELQDELKASNAAKEAATQKAKDAEKKTSEAIAKAAQSVKEAEKKAKDAADKSLKEAEKKVQDAEKRAKDAADKAKKASDESNSAANKKKSAQQAASSKKEADEAAKNAEAAKKEVEAAKKEAEAAKQEVVTAKTAAEAAKKAADAAAAAEKEAREELESMVLVIEDIEKKRDEYKGKVRELGGEVSEEEDDSDDSEEDDDDEDGDVTLD